MSVRIFLSTVSDEFRAYRDQLRGDLTRPNVEVKVQEDFKDQGGDTLDLLDKYIASCDAVVHLVGDMTGSAPGEYALTSLRAKYADLETRLSPLGEALKKGSGVSYTQWEAWLALYHAKPLFIAQAADKAERGPKYLLTDASRAEQAAHLARLKAMGRYPGCTFTSPDNLSKQILGSAILDLLAKAEVVAYAQAQGHDKDVAEGFIHEMAQKVAGDRNLDIEGKKKAVRNAIEIYLREIAGGQSPTNYDAIVDRALIRARSLVDEGRSGLARAALRKACDALRQEEEERRQRYVAGVSALYHRERDIALAAYDGEGAADAIIALAEALHGENAAGIVGLLSSQADALYAYGGNHGSNVHLAASIVLRRELSALAASGDERGAAHVNLASALATLGWLESGTARLDEAVAAFREALKELTRDRAPLNWAQTQMGLGYALFRLGERASGTARLDEAVAAYREALKELTRGRAPLHWAGAKANIGGAVVRLAERESGTARLDEAVAAFREALAERTRERVPLDWAQTQNDLGYALWRLGEREGGTARLTEAVTALREALTERTRDRAPLFWAQTQNNLGNALQTLGERESGTARLDEAVAAYREALKERTRERAPLQWAYTKHGLANGLAELAKRKKNFAIMDEALACLRDAIEGYQQAGESYQLPMAQSRVTEMQAELNALKR